MLHPAGRRFNGGQISPTGQELPHHGEIAAQWLKMVPESPVRPNNWSQNGQPESPIWVVPAHAGRLRRL
jgi:hypothetical protein